MKGLLIALLALPLSASALGQAPAKPQPGAFAFAGSRPRAVVFPGDAWESRTAKALGLDTAKLAEFAAVSGGAGMVVRDGYAAYTWGRVDEQLDWASAIKPVLGMLLMFAIDEDLLSSPDDAIGSHWDKLTSQDDRITFRQLANNTSGYALPERPGRAWGYNDYGTRLLCRSLRKVFNGRTVAQSFRRRTDALQLEDPLLGARERCAMLISIRDFARVGWLWANHGRWGDRQIVPQTLFDSIVQVAVPGTQRISRGDDTSCDNYLRLNTFGAGCNATQFGPGIFGYGWWFNGRVGTTGLRPWPAAPADTFLADGNWDARVVIVMRSLGLVVVAHRVDINFDSDFERLNARLKLLAEAVID